MSNKSDALLIANFGGDLNGNPLTDTSGGDIVIDEPTGKRIVIKMSSTEKVSTTSTGLYVGADAAPVFQSCLLHLDNNGNSTLPLAIFQQNHATKFAVDQNGCTFIFPTTSSSNALELGYTLDTGSGSRYGILNNTTATGTPTGNRFALRSNLTGSYTGAGPGAAFYGRNNTSGTGTNYFNGAGGNFGICTFADTAPSGANVGAFFRANGSSVLNLGALCVSNSNLAGKNVGLMAYARNTSSGGATGAYIGMDSSDPIANFTNTALLVTNSAEAVPIAIFRDNTTDAVRIENGGYVNITPAQLGGGVYASSQSALKVDGTLPSATGFSPLVRHTAHVLTGTLQDLAVATQITLDGTSDAKLSMGLAVYNDTDGTATDWWNFHNNIGTYSQAYHSTSGVNIGSVGFGYNSSTLNIGVYGQGYGTGAGTKVIGVHGDAIPEGPDVVIGGYFGLDGSTAASNTNSGSESAALIANNSGAASPIAIFRDGTTDKVRIEDGGQITLATGTASAPSLGHISDLNTGLNFQADDLVEIVTGGTARLRFLNTGNIDNGASGSADTLNSLTVGGMLFTGTGGSSKNHGMFVGNTDVTGSQHFWLTNPTFTRQFNMQLTNASHATPDTAYLQTTATGGLRILSTAGNIDLRVGDTAGVNKVSIQDLGNVEVASIDSDGNATFNGSVSITTGQLATSGGSSLAITGTLNDGGGYQIGINSTISISDAATGSALFGQQVLLAPVNAYAGTGLTAAYAGVNTVAGTGTAWFELGANFGAGFNTFSSTSGVNVGACGVASGSSSMNIGVSAIAYGPGTGAKVVGVTGQATPTGSDIFVGVYAGLAASTTEANANLTASAGLLVTNNSQAVPVAIFRDNTTDVLRIEDGGQVVMKSDGGLKLQTSDATTGAFIRTVHANTTNATPKTLTFDGATATSSNIPSIAVSTTHGYTVTVTGRDTTNGVTAAYVVIEVVLERSAGGTVSSVALSTNPVYTTGGASVTALADDTNKGLNVQVTGIAATNISWIARITETAI